MAGGSGGGPRRQGCREEPVLSGLRLAATCFPSGKCVPSLTPGLCVQASGAEVLPPLQSVNKPQASSLRSL